MFSYYLPFITFLSFCRQILQLSKVMTGRSSEASDFAIVEIFCTDLTGPYAIAM